MNRKLIFLGILLMFGAVSCGGEGSGLAGARNGSVDPEDPDAEPPIVLDSIELLASSPQLQSDGSETITLSALTKNAENQLVEGASVIFSASSGALFVLEPTTTAQGTATAELTTGGDPTNRTIQVTATSGTISTTLDIAVIGSSVQIQGPTSLVSDATATYTITLVDSAGAGIPNETVEITSSSGNTLSASSVTTDSNGRVTVDLTGNVAGADTLTVTALPNVGAPTVTATVSVNVSGDDFSFTTPASNAEIDLLAAEDVTVLWEKNGAPQAGQSIRFATTRGTVTPATFTTNAAGEATIQISSTTAGPAVITATNPDDTTTQLSVEFVATTPNQVSLQADPGVIGTTETSTITAIVQDAANNRVKNATVEFTLTDTTGGTLSTPSAVTDSQGRAQTIYTASSVTSADDGVAVTGRVVGTGLQATTNLTVSGRALFIVFGTGNTIIEDDADTIYTKDYSLFVSDSSGKGVAGSTVNVRILPTAFLKGFLELDAVTNEWEQTVAALCASEDTNGNGILDTTPILEDVNGDGELSPGNVAVVSPGTITTDESGQASFHISYPQNYAMWVAGRITASATVAGTESRKSAGFFFPASAADLSAGNTPPNTISPWGIGASCADTN